MTSYNPISKPRTGSNHRVSGSQTKKTRQIFRKLRRLSTIIFSGMVIFCLYIGWLLKDEYLITPERGLGYALGIIGGSLMLLLLLYPVKKHFSRVNLILSTKSWFRLHMFLGIVGPVLIMFHCNFNLGSFNSSMALFFMLLMVTSGLIGRYIYSKINYGVYNKQAMIKHIHRHKIFSAKQLSENNKTSYRFITPEVSKRLKAFEKEILVRQNIMNNFKRMIRLSFTTRSEYKKICAELDRFHETSDFYIKIDDSQKARFLKTLHRQVAMYMNAIRKVAKISFYERLFSMWHILHFPIFCMLIITGFVHVYAVHNY